MRAPTIRQFRESFGCWLPICGKWKGDAYGYHPHGVIMRPMIYTDHHSISGACDAQVMTDRHAKFKPRAEGREASLGNSGLSPNPTPETGELVTIYRNGEWLGPDGPWRAQMRRDMAAALRNKRQLVRAQKAEAERIRQDRESSIADSYESAKRAFA